MNWKSLILLCLVLPLLLSFTMGGGTLENGVVMTERNSGLVTEDEKYIYVENDFYRAFVRKNDTGVVNQAYFGSIEHLMLKPRNVEISATKGSVLGLGVHEYQDAVTLSFPAQFGSLISCLSG